MVQGDEPMTHPNMISEAIKPLIENETVVVSNLLGKIESNDEFKDRNTIKVVIDKFNNAIYMSREPIPTRCKSEKIQKYKQVCIIPFKRDFLIEYTKMSQTPLEIAESIDMLRVIENGISVKMVQTNYKTHAVDTPEDLEKVVLMMKQDWFE